MPRSSARGWAPDALGVRQVAGVVVGHASPAAGAAAATGPSSTSTSETSRTFAANAGGPLGVRRVVGEQLAVLLHRRAAAGRVDHDALDPGGARRRRPAGGRSACASASRPLWTLSAPQQPCRRGITTSQPSAASTRAVAALTSGKNAPCTQPVSMPTTARRAPAGGDPLRQPARPGPAGGASASIAASVGASRSSSPLRRTSRLQAGPLVRPQRPAQQPQPARVREQREDRLAQQPVRRRAVGAGARPAPGWPR